MPNAIYETYFKDIIDIISDVKDVADGGSKAIGRDKNTFKSLTREANKLILVFPVLCTKGISIETASMITKAIEKHCVTLLQMLFASVQITDVTTLHDYISKYHSNISLGDKITVDDFVSFTKVFESAVDAGEIQVTDRAVYEQFTAGMKQFNDVIKTTVNEHSLSDYLCHKTYNGYETVLENKNINPGNFEFEQKKEWIGKLSDNDIKKANELMPTKVIVNFHSTTADAKFERGIIGVKCKLYTVDSMELVERLSTKYNDTNWVKELIRASTGEISFWRDFILALDKAKIDAINSNKSGSSAKMWKVLERRAAKHRLGRWKANRADSSPITTLIINQDEVEYLKKEYDMNLEHRKVAISIMDAYNFMGIVIADEPSETASFIWDEGNDAEFETLSFRNLERESNDKNYKKVINLMTKLSR